MSIFAPGASEPLFLARHTHHLYKVQNVIGIGPVQEQTPQTKPTQQKVKDILIGSVNPVSKSKGSPKRPISQAGQKM